MTPDRPTRKIDRAEFRKLRNQGWTTKELAAHFGAHEDSIHKIRRELGLPAHKRRGKIDRQELSQLHEQGKTTSQLAEHFSAHVDSITRIKNELGLTIDKRMTPERLARLTQMVNDGWSFKEIHRTEGADMETLRKYFPGRSWTHEQCIEYLRLRRMETKRHFNEHPKHYDQTKYQPRTHPVGATNTPGPGTPDTRPDQRGQNAAQGVQNGRGRVIGHAA